MKKIIFYGIYFSSPILMIRVLFGINPGKYTEPNMFIAMCFGVAAYNWFVWQFILSSRPKFIDAIIGLDKIYRLHGMTALGSIGLALVHNSIFEKIYGDNLLTFLGSLSLYIYMGVSILSILFLTKDKWRKLKLIITIEGVIGKWKKFRYEYFKLLHNLTIIALIFMQVHVLLTKAAKTYNTVFMLYMTYFIVAIGFYTYHKILRPWIVKENKWQVKNILQLSKDVWSVDMDSTTHKIKYKPGQFGFFKIKTNKGYEQHPFSFTSSPQSSEISIAVKALGDFSSSISCLKKGDPIYLDGPYGGFSYVKHPKEDKTFFIAGGVGITPILSMIRHMSYVQPNRQVTLLWGIRKKDDLLYQKDFDTLMKRMPNLNVVPVVSGDQTYGGEKGYIDFDKLLKYIGPNKVYDRRQGYYICGPSILMKKSVECLRDLGIKPFRIHYESFSF